MGYLQRDKELKLVIMDTEKTLKRTGKKNVVPEAVIVTDGLNAYRGLDKDF